MKRIFSLVVLFVSVLASAAWVPPNGIPNPADTWAGFGEIDQPTPPWPESWRAATPSATEGYYFVDNSDPAATNTSNPWGYPGKPRFSLPQGTLPAGTFIYIHGGLYTPARSAGDRYDWRGVGTPTRPIWITGNPANKPIFRELVHIGVGAAGETDYFVLENIEFSGSSGGSIRIHPTVEGVNVRHVLIRNVTVRHLGVAADDGGILVGISSTFGGFTNSVVEDVVAYNNNISYCGDRLTTDTTGFYNGFHTRRVWCVDNVIHHVGADSIAGSHYSNGTTRKTEDYYIGRNVCYGNGENGIDIKGADRVVISQNTIFGPFEREQGGAIVLHYGASPPTTVKNVAVLFNRVFHCSAGIGTGLSSGVDNMIVVGNLFYDISNAYAAASDSLNGACVQIGGSSGDLYIANNTFHSFDKGIYISHLGTVSTVAIHGNIFSARNNNTHYDIFNGEQSILAVSDHNVYTPSPRFFWNGGARSLAYLQSFTQEINSREADPGFSNPAGGDFSLRNDSICIDAGAEFSVYDVFNSETGISIMVDFTGRRRPSGGEWDVGAYEFVPLAAPTKPKEIRIEP